MGWESTARTLANLERERECVINRLPPCSPRASPSGEPHAGVGAGASVMGLLLEGSHPDDREGTRRGWLAGEHGA
jgi:hypothetical protein